MHAFMQFLAGQPYILLFFTVGLSVWIGRFTIKGYGLGMVAAAIIVGCVISIAASAVGIRLQLDEFTKSLFYFLFMYGVGLRVGPSFVNAIKGDGLKFVVLSMVSCTVGLTIVVLGAIWLDLPLGAAGGMLAGSQTMSAALGSAEQAVTSGAIRLPPGTTPEQVSAMIALSYGITYIWGTVGIVLITKYLPRWWGIDARAAALEYEKQFGVTSVDDAGLTGFRPYDLRAYRLDNPRMVGKTIAQFRAGNPEYQVVNVERGGDNLGADEGQVLQRGDIVVLGGRLEALTDKMGLIGPEVPDATALNIPLDQAEVLVTKPALEGHALKELRAEAVSGQIQLTRIERRGVPIPIGPEVKLEKLDVLFLTGLKPAVERAGQRLGRVARHTVATDLLTLSLGMILGVLIGLIEIPAFGAKVGLGTAGGLLVSGVIVSSVSARLRFFGDIPNAARNLMEDLGLVVFVAIVGINAGASLLEQLTGLLALKIFLIGFVACSLPPIVVWVIGHHGFKLNAAILMGAVAGSRSHSGPCREAAHEIDSSVPWLGFPVGYALSGVLITVFGYFAMVLAQ